MKTLLLRIIYITFGIGFIFFTLYSQEPEDNTKRIEKKWGMEDDDKKIVVKKAVTVDNPVPLFLTQFHPDKQEYPINPTMENMIVGKMGTKITIPPNSIVLPMGYKRGDILTLELIEVYNDLDFITSGISLEYFNPNPNIFESGGMFKLTASYFDKPLNLKRGVKLKVEIPSLIFTDKKMNAYKFDEKQGWVDKGEISNSGETNVELRSNLLFKFMDDFKWWNCDYPNSDTTCIEGKILPFENNTPFSVTSVGIDYKNAATRYADNSGKFQMNAIKGKRIKLIAMDSKGNIGLLAEINTGNLAAFLGATGKDKCTDVGSIQIKKVDREILKDRTKLLNHLGLYDLK
ncbi:MAG: hypothetical protein KBA66_02655 [Leptospiraceae bacterium]|nr:hypothetical protein [Leptospiraceae bacterium]